MSSLLLASSISLLLLLLLHRAGAAEYTVGDGPFAWDTGINYATWVRNHTFAVGDVLVFQYVKSQHNVYQVTETTYRSCNTGGGAGVLKMYTSGYDRVELKEAKTYWFICDVPGHCVGGMKVAVNVSAGAAGGRRPSPNVPLPSSGNAASPAGGRRSWVAWATLAVVLINWTK